MRSIAPRKNRKNSPTNRRPSNSRRRDRVLFLESLENRSLLATIAYDVPAGTAGNQNFGGSLGMDFNVSSPITVTNLGAFDSNSDGINGTINVRLYDRTNSAVPLASASFTGTGQQLVGGSRFLPIPALNLPAGFQGRIVADGYNAAEFNGNSGGGAPVWMTNSGGALTFSAGGFFGAAGAYPTTGDGGPANRYAAGTFTFVPQPVTSAYVDDNWAAFAPGDVILDADAGTTGNQSGVFGVDAFATIASALAAIPASGTVIVNDGTYPEAVNLPGTQTLGVTGPNAPQTVSIDSLTTVAGTTVAIDGTSTLQIVGGASTTVAGIITGTGGLTKAGAGTLTLSGGNTYTGATMVTAGTLAINQVGPGSNNGNIGLGANTQLTTSAVNVAAGAFVNFNTGSNFSSSNTGTMLSGAGTIRLLSGTWWMGNAGGGTVVAMAAGGLIDVQAGTMKNDYASANWGGNQASLNVAGGAFFNLRNNNVTVNSLTGAGSVFNDFATNTLTIGVANGSGLFSGTIGPGGVSLHLVKTGTGTQTLTGASTYTGTTAIQNGTLILTGGNNRLPTSTSITLGSGVNSGRLQLGDAGGPSDQAITGLVVSGLGASNSVVGGNAAISTLTVNRSTTAFVYSGRLGGAGANENNLALTANLIGGAVMYLDGANTYSGVTNVIGGGGYLVARNNSALGSTAAGTVISSGNTLQLEFNGSDVNIGAEPLTISGTGVGGTRGALASWTGNNSFAGDITLAANSSIYVPTNAPNNSLTLTGAISGAGFGITKTGGNDLTFAGATSNTYTGTTVLDVGSLYLSKTGGAVAISGPVQMGGGNGNQPNLRMTQPNQFAAGVVMTGAAGQTSHARFDLQGNNQTLAGIASPGQFLVVQNERLGGGFTTAPATLTLNGSGAYSFAGYLRNEDDGGNVYPLSIIKSGTGDANLRGRECQLQRLDDHHSRRLEPRHHDRLPQSHEHRRRRYDVRHHRKPSR